MKKSRISPSSISRLVLVASFAELVSCAPTIWTKPGFDLQTWRIDDNSCITHAANLFPPQYHSYQLPGYTAPISTNCYTNGSYTNCETTGGQSYPITVSKDLNESNRHTAWEACIRARGYYPVGEEHQISLSPPETAERGDVDAQFRLGMMYDTGQGVPQNYKQAMSWYLKAAKQGHAQAQHDVGVMYYRGLGVRRNYKQAMRWYLKAAEQEDPIAQYSLGVMYHQGQGVSPDEKEALKWFILARNNGYAEASEQCHKLAAHMTPADVKKAETMAWEWRAKHPKR